MDIGVSAIIFLNNHLITIKRKKGYIAGEITLPAGKVKDGESPLEGLIREVKEELNIAVVGATLVHLLYCRKGEEEWLNIFYEISDFTGDIINMEPDKHDIVSVEYGELAPHIQQVLKNIKLGIAYSEYKESGG